MNISIAEWIKVVTNPLGLTAFALFLIFAYSAKSVRQPRWLKSLLGLLAAVVIVGGLFLAYEQNKPDQSQPALIEQKTSGDNSPAGGVNGDVNIRIEQGGNKK